MATEAEFSVWWFELRVAGNPRAKARFHGERVFPLSYRAEFSVWWFELRVAGNPRAKARFHGERVFAGLKSSSPC